MSLGIPSAWRAGGRTAVTNSSLRRPAWVLIHTRCSFFMACLVDWFCLLKPNTHICQSKKLKTRRMSQFGGVAAGGGVPQVCESLSPSCWAGKVCTAGLPLLPLGPACSPSGTLHVISLIQVEMSALAAGPGHTTFLPSHSVCFRTGQSLLPALTRTQSRLTKWLRGFIPPWFRSPRGWDGADALAELMESKNSEKSGPFLLPASQRGLLC